MWLPKTEADIIQAVSSGALEESSIFDAKEELSKTRRLRKTLLQWQIMGA